MKKLFVLVAGMLLAGSVLASDLNCNGGGGNDTINCGNTNLSGGAGGAGGQGGQGGQGGKGGDGGFAISGSKSEANAFAAAISGSVAKATAPTIVAPVQEVNTPRQAVPAAAVSAAGTTANCRVAGGFSLGGVTGGISISGSVRDEYCSLIDLGKGLIWAGVSTNNAQMVAKGTAVLEVATAMLLKEVKHTSATFAEVTTPVHPEGTPTPFQWGLDSSN